MATGSGLPRAVAGLVINAFLLPGAGTLIGGGRTRDGLVQLVVVLALPLGLATAVSTMTRSEGPDASQALFPFAIVAVLVGLVVWAWSIVTMALIVTRERSAGVEA